MTRYHAVNVSDRVAKWRESGWKGFDASAPALTAEDIRRERALYSNRDLNRGQVAIPVVKEVMVNKDVRQRTQTVRDTVKKTEVDVDQDALERLSGEPNMPSRR